jgi:hypothetical protein
MWKLCGLVSGIITACTYTDREKHVKNWLRMTGLRACIWTQDPPNTEVVIILHWILCIFLDLWISLQTRYFYVKFCLQNKFKTSREKQHILRYQNQESCISFTINYL